MGLSNLDISIHFGVKECYRAVSLASINFPKKVLYAKNWKINKELNQLSDLPKMIVIEMVGGCYSLGK